MHVRRLIACQIDPKITEYLPDFFVIGDSLELWDFWRYLDEFNFLDE